MATVRPDGRPHLVPIWFVALEERIWICTGRRSVKIANLRSNPAISVSSEDGDDPWVVEGRAIVSTEGYPEAVVVAFEEKYGWDITLPDDPDVGDTALIEVVVDRWLFGGPTGS